jgi:hypothetical protein
MCNVIKEMSDHVPKGLFRFHVFLAANMAIFPLYRSAAVQAILFLSLRDMRQTKIFLKNKYKKIQAPFLFPLLNNSGNFD